MRKFIWGIALAFAFALVPAWAHMVDALQWMDSVPGVQIKSTKVEHDEVKKEYLMKSNRPYNQIVQNLKSKGWTVSGQRENFECPDMPKLYLVKDGCVIKIDVDRERGFEGSYYEMEIELESRYDD